jgi:uroporphyrinogen-III synthase
VLVLRAAGDAAATAARLAARGHAPLVAPLFDPRPLPWEPPARPPAALALTSARAAELAGPGLAAFAALPAWCVGEATARAARAAGLARAQALGAGGAAGLAVAIAALDPPPARLLWLAGRERVAIPPIPGCVVEERAVYAVELLPLAPAAARALAGGAIDCVLLHSPRMAAWFAAECDRLGLARGQLQLAALSPGVAAAAGPGWAGVSIADRPEEAALLAAAGL